MQTGNSGQLSAYTKGLRNPAERSIDGPDLCAGCCKTRGNQMQIREADSLGPQPSSLDHEAHVRKAHHWQRCQLVQIREGLASIRKRAASQLRHNEGMNTELVPCDQSFQLGLEPSLAEHLDPYGSIGQNHFVLTRVLRTFSRFGAVPAIASSLRPASLAIRHFKASRISSALSVTPVYSCAVLKRSSSSEIVALKSTSIAPMLALSGSNIGSLQRIHPAGI